MPVGWNRWAKGPVPVMSSQRSLFEKMSYEWMRKSFSYVFHVVPLVLFHVLFFTHTAMSCKAVGSALMAERSWASVIEA